MTTSNSEIHRFTPLWSVQDVSAYLQVPVHTLYAWRSQGGGPPARKIGKYLRYVPDDVVMWVEGLRTEVA